MHYKDILLTIIAINFTSVMYPLQYRLRFDFSTLCPLQIDFIVLYCIVVFFLFPNSFYFRVFYSSIYQRLWRFLFR